MGKLIVQLSGGLGNQMFQYAFGKSLSKKNNLTLVLDVWSGFVRDNEYKRNYELHNFPISVNKANFIQKIPFWVLRILKRFRILKKIELIKFYAIAYIIETKPSYNKNLHELTNLKSTWVEGYWQSYLYFEDIKTEILNDFKIKKPQFELYNDIAKLMSNKISISVCLRFYEESKNPSIHSRFNEQFKIIDIYNLIKYFENIYNETIFLIFSSVCSDKLSDLFPNNNFVFITPDKGFDNNLSVLWLITQCRHHIITNSTYYWWGAWLSQFENNHKDDQLIFASKQFINTESIPLNWKLF